jgi:hypothetical protein
LDSVLSLTLRIMRVKEIEKFELKDELIVKSGFFYGCGEFSVIANMNPFVNRRGVDITFIVKGDYAAVILLYR